MTTYYSNPRVRLSDAYVISQDITAMQQQAMRDVANSPTTYDVPVIPGPLTPGPISGEIVDPSGGVVTVPVVDLRAHPADYVTMTGVLEAFDKGPQSHAERRSARPPVPAWALACLFLGLVLIGCAMAGYAYIQNM